jgi:hypothetical protein
MPVVHRIRKIVGTVLAIACVALALYALVRLVQGGSCASGGNYVSTRQCPPGTGWWAFELPVGIIGSLFFFFLANMKLGKAREEMNANTIRAATLRSSFGTSGGPQAFTFGPEGAQTFTIGSEGLQAFTVGPEGFRPFAAPAAAAQDPHARLERLRVLRDANALTPAEYEAAKAKILSEM